MIEIVFFDAGGTILDAHPSFSGLFGKVCRDAGFDVTDDDVAAVQGRIAPHLMDLEPQDGAPSYAGSSFSAEKARAFWTHFYERVLTELELPLDLAPSLFDTFTDPSSYKLFEDVRPCMDALRSADKRIGLISNFESWLEEMLVELEMGDIFDVAVISGHEGIEKPDVAIYEIALEKAHVSGGSAVHVGDSPTYDAEPASEAGIHPVLIDRAGRYPEAEWPRLPSLEGLPDLVAKM
ncbi:MAG: HAD-IA family hydrolase [Actinomycetota bacterium]|nr:HAD-IA family hydrolase [Actinomycetota bacterium]